MRRVVVSAGWFGTLRVLYIEQPAGSTGWFHGPGVRPGLAACSGHATVCLTSLPMCPTGVDRGGPCSSNATSTWPPPPPKFCGKGEVNSGRCANPKQCCSKVRPGRRTPEQGRASHKPVCH